MGNTTQRYYSKSFLDTNAQWESNIFTLANIHQFWYILISNKDKKKQEGLFMEYALSTLSPGDALQGSRYHLLKQLSVPPSQQAQRADWLASDAQSSGSTVLLHQIKFSLIAPSDQEKIIQTMTQNLTELAEHPGFLPVIDVFQERGAYYIVQSYPEGESLASLLKQQGGTLPEAEVAEYGLQLCTMLSQLAQSPLPFVNGFLSAETILISPDKRQVWLLSFPRISKNAVTADQAPEPVEGSPSSALFSLAATLHHALTGSDPDENPASSYPPARSLNPAVTPQMDALLARALHSLPSQRLTDPVQMQQELSRLIASSSSSSPASPSFPVEKAQSHKESHQTGRRNLWIAVGLGTVILLLLLVTLYPLLASYSTTPATNAAQRAAYQKRTQSGIASLSDNGNWRERWSPRL